MSKPMNPFRSMAKIAKNSIAHLDKWERDGLERITRGGGESRTKTRWTKPKTIVCKQVVYNPEDFTLAQAVKLSDFFALVKCWREEANDDRPL